MPLHYVSKYSTYVHIYTCMYCMYVCMYCMYHGYMYVCMHVYMYVRVYISTLKFREKFLKIKLLSTVMQIIGLHKNNVQSLHALHHPKILFLVPLLFVALLNSIPTYLLNFEFFSTYIYVIYTYVCAHVYSLEEGGVVTECSIKTHEAVETLDFEFYGSTVVNKIIMKVSTHVIYQSY